ncbi:MAG: glycosyltransferase family 4 protein [Pseudomonadota bacterium]
MKILQFLPEDPNSGTSGSDLRNAALSEVLADMFDVTQVVLAVNNHGVMSDAADAQNAFDSVADGDLLLFSGPMFAPLMRVAQRRFGAKVFIGCDFHNIESDLLEQSDRARFGIFAGPLNQRRWKRARVLDCEALAIADLALVCSAADADRAIALGGRNVVTAPNVVPKWCDKLTASPRCDDTILHPKLLFVGHLGYRPNKNAVNFIVKKLKPRLPRARVTVAGRRPGKRLSALVTKSGQSLIADPVSLVDIYRHADIAIMPLFEGGGTRIKALEAFSCGLPVVATAKAVEGLGVVDGKHFLRAENAEDFERAIVDLCTDGAKRAALTEAAHHYVQNNFTRKHLKRVVLSAVQNLHEMR